MIQDPVAEGLSRGWTALDASTLEKDIDWETDVVVIGTGSGGGVCAEMLTEAGFDVVLIEEGPLRSSGDFTMEERMAYRDLYQEHAARQTKDKSVVVLQGRCVGGGTTVNWTSSFDTPPQTLNHWTEAHGVTGCSPAEMDPWFRKFDERLNVGPWEVPPNVNNEVLRRGAEKLGWSSEVMRRNIRGCANLGYCGLGCPINAKQSMLVTTLPAAMDRGARLAYRTRAERLEWKGDRIEALHCAAMDDLGSEPTGRKLRIRARHYVCAAGAIGSPALLLRSRVPDPGGVVGTRTFLHPVNLCVAMMPERVEAFRGAPQSIFSDEFLWKDGVTGRMGYKLEVPPLYPMISSTVHGSYGKVLADMMKRFPYLQSTLTLGRDGFHEGSPGGTVELLDDGTPKLDYPITEYLKEGFRRAVASMVELQFAAGAEGVYVMHRQQQNPWRSWQEAKQELASMSMEKHQLRVFSAHVMGGCRMGEDVNSSVVNSSGFHHHLANLSVIDGSVFPTSIGSNPQVSIFGMSGKNTTSLIERLRA
ncbi:MAG: GMC family oxidoreductase [Acidobacteriota bacterium]|nr:GMC family oxidoreductase [Acidobacteriota bacterium]